MIPYLRPCVPTGRTPHECESFLRLLQNAKIKTLFTDPVSSEDDNTHCYVDLEARWRTRDAACTNSSESPVLVGSNRHGSVGCFPVLLLGSKLTGARRTAAVQAEAIDAAVLRIADDLLPYYHKSKNGDTE